MIIPAVLSFSLKFNPLFRTGMNVRIYCRPRQFSIKPEYFCVFRFSISRVIVPVLFFRFEEIDFSKIAFLFAGFYDHSAFFIDCGYWQI